MRTLPMGTGYAVWTGIGAAGTAIVESWCWATLQRRCGSSVLDLILAGVIGLKLVTPE